MTASDGIHVSVTISAARESVFRAFTEDIAKWWKGGPRYRFTPGEHQTMYLEPRLGGRLLAYPMAGRRIPKDEQDCALEPFEVGRVLSWEPTTRLVLSWRLPNYAAGETTEVEIRFVEISSATGGVATQVHVAHRGWADLAPQHPATHGHTGAALTMMVGGWWRDLIKSLASELNNLENRYE